MADDLSAHRRDSPLQTLAIKRIEQPEAIPREISSRSASVSVRPERRRTAGANPTTPRQQELNHHMAFCPGPVQSHATTVPPSSDPTARSSVSQKASIVSLAS